MWWLAFLAIMLAAAGFLWGAGLGLGMIACGIASVALYLAPRGGPARAEPVRRPIRLMWLAPLAGLALGFVAGLLAAPPPS